jgi:hypothetical protein
MSSVLRGESPPQGDTQTGPPASPPPFPPGAAPTDGGGAQRNNTLTVIAGVGVLLLAMGVGVLIGRAGSPKQSAAPAQVITVSSPSSGGATTPTAEASFTGDWPSGTSGYTVQLQTLPQSGTALSAVESAKSAASAKGAKAVGALKSEEFASLTSGTYVIYSGVYHKKAEAQTALAGLRKSFPAAKVIDVSNSGSSSSTSTGGSSKSTSSGGSSSAGKGNPAATSPDLRGVKGKTYEEKSKNVPNEVEF